jgi:hypothetical protein
MPVSRREESLCLIQALGSRDVPRRARKPCDEFVWSRAMWSLLIHSLHFHKRKFDYELLVVSIEGDLKRRCPIPAELTDDNLDRRERKEE